MKKALPYFLLIFVVLACQKDCDEELIEFTVQVQKANGTAVRLNRYFTLSKGGDTLVNERLDSNMAAITSRYTLLLSTSLEQTENVTFYGFQGSTLIANETYKAMHDGCKISEVSGETTIVVP